MNTFNSSSTGTCPSWLVFAFATLVACSTVELNAQPTDEPPSADKPATDEQPDGKKPHDLTDNAPPVADELIVKWIRQLDDDEYETRENASEMLLLHGEQAVKPLAEMIPGGSLEHIIRSIKVLTAIAVSDTAAHKEAQLAILRLSELQPSVAGRYARSSLRPVSAAARVRSIRQLEDDGAKPIYRDPEDPRTTMIGFTFDDDWAGQEDDFQLLQFIKNIQTLELIGPKVKPSWFKHFAPIRTLTTIKIKDANINRDAIDQLITIETLRYLELKFVKVGDKEVPALAALKQLQQLALIGTDVTVDGKNKLELGLAGTEVDHRSGGFLGVRGGSHAIGCFVDDVVEDTAAAKAGIRQGDVIVYYNGKRILDFDALRDGIAQHPPGESVKVRVMRADTLQAVHVFQKGDALGAEFKKHEFGLEIDKLDGRDSFLVRRQFRPGDVIVQYHTLLQPTEKQLVDQLKQAENRLVKDRLSTQMMVTALRNPEIVELKLKLGRFE
jgi:hypothetical protein